MLVLISVGVQLFDCSLWHFASFFDLAQNIKLLLGSGTLYVAGINLKKYTDLASIDALSKLRDRLYTDKKCEIHKVIMDKKSLQKTCRIEDCKGCLLGNNVEINDYLGTLELGGFMYERELMSEDEFDNQFSYRVNNVFKVMEVCPILKKKIEKEGHYVELKKMQERNDKQNN